MEFLKSILGDDLFKQFKTAVDGYNTKPENKDKQIAIDNVASGYVKQDKYDNLLADKTTLETNYSNAKTTLKSFEGVDVTELQGQIATLNQTIKDNDKAHADALADITFNSSVKEAITKAGAKNDKTVMALLDLDTLKSSKNLDTDLKLAIEACQKENDYLFGSNEPISNPIAPTGGTNPLAGTEAYMNQIDAVMGISSNK